MNRFFTFLWIGSLLVAGEARGMECGDGFRAIALDTLVLTREEAATLGEGELAARGEAAFRLADAIKRTPLKDRPDGGRRFDIPLALKTAIRDRAEAVLGIEGRGEDIIAKGNLGHQGDHTDLYHLNNTPSEEFPNGAYRDVFGVEPEDVYLAKVVHDLGKLPSTERTKHVRKYISDQTGGDFLKTRILGHGFDSIARVAELVQEEGDRLGLSKEDQMRSFLQLADAISWHNYGPATDVATAKSRYKSLSDQEVSTLVNAFWPTFFNNGIKTPDGKVVVSSFASDLGIEPYGSSADRSVIQKLLTLDDRVALVTENAPDKIGNQNLKTNDPGAKTFNRTIIEKTFISPAKETVVAVRAMGEELAADIVNPDFTVTAVPSYRRGIDLASQLRKTGERVLEMNSPENLRELGVSDAEAEHTLVYRDKGGVWWKVDGSNKTAPTVSMKLGERWVDSGESTLTEGTAFDSLLKLLRRDTGGKLLTAQTN